MRLPLRYVIEFMENFTQRISRSDAKRQRPQLCVKSILLPLFFFFIMNVNAQTTIVRDADSVRGTTVVIPEKKFDRSGYHNMWWGKNYRKEWSTPVRVNNFYLDTARSGLTPYQI